MRCQCQYCNERRTHQGWWGDAPVSLCTRHCKQYGQDFDRVTKVRMCGIPACDDEAREGNFGVCEDHYKNVMGAGPS